VTLNVAPALKPLPLLPVKVIGVAVAETSADKHNPKVTAVTIFPAVIAFINDALYGLSRFAHSSISLLETK
jgi:hypothetical protein